MVALCAFQDLRSQSDPSTVMAATLPLPVKNLRLEECTSASMTVAWEPGTLTANPEANVRYKVAAINSDINYRCVGLSWTSDQSSGVGRY